MEVNQEWTHCTESNPDVEFLIPDSLGAESDLSSHFNYRELPALQILSEVCVMPFTYFFMICLSGAKSQAMP